jgi:hypothetical protein
VQDKPSDVEQRHEQQAFASLPSEQALKPTIKMIITRNNLITGHTIVMMSCLVPGNGENR